MPNDQGSLATSVAGQPAQRAAVDLPAQALDLIRERLHHAKDGGEPLPADPSVMARYLMTVDNGIAVQAGDGASAIDQHRVAEAALSVWS